LGRTRFCPLRTCTVRQAQDCHPQVTPAPPGIGPPFSCCPVSPAHPKWSLNTAPRPARLGSPKFVLRPWSWWCPGTSCAGLPPPTLTCICTWTCLCPLGPLSMDKAGLLSGGRQALDPAALHPGPCSTSCGTCLWNVPAFGTWVCPRKSCPRSPNAGGLVRAGQVGSGPVAERGCTCPGPLTVWGGFSSRSRSPELGVKAGQWLCRPVKWDVSWCFTQNVDEPRAPPQTRGQ